MSAHTYINDEWTCGVQISLEDDGAIYIDCGESTVSLQLNVRNLESLIAAAQRGIEHVRQQEFAEQCISGIAADIPTPVTPEPMDGAQ